MMHSVTADQFIVRCDVNAKKRQTEDSDEKSRDRRMCISPGDNRSMSGDYSVHM